MIDGFDFLMNRGDVPYDFEDDRRYAEERAINLQPEPVRRNDTKFIRMLEEIWEEIGDRHY